MWSSVRWRLQLFQALYKSDGAEHDGVVLCVTTRIWDAAYSHHFRLLSD